MRRKTISLILTLALCIGLAVPALAAEQTVENDFYTIIIRNLVNETVIEYASINGTATAPLYWIPASGSEVVFVDAERLGDPDGDAIEHMIWDLNEYDDGIFHASLGWDRDWAELPDGSLGYNLKPQDYIYTQSGAPYTVDYFIEGNAIVRICNFFFAFTDDDSTPPTPADPLDSASDWARDYVAAALAKGFVPADIQNDYQNVITRAEFCRMAIKWVEYAMGDSIDAILAEKGLTRDTDAFTDTSDPDILAAYALGITSGIGGGLFSPGGQFDRQQAAAMIMNTCRAIGADVSDPPPSGFADMEAASIWTVDGINFVRANGIMQGTGDNNFSPTDPYTREQSIITFSNINYDELPGI